MHEYLRNKRRGIKKTDMNQSKFQIKAIIVAIEIIKLNNLDKSEDCSK